MSKPNTTKGLLQQSRFRLAAACMAALLLLIFAAEALSAGAAGVSQGISDAAAVLCALIATFAFVWEWRKMDDREVAKTVWGFLTIGILLKYDLHAGMTPSAPAAEPALAPS